MKQQRFEVLGERLLTAGVAPRHVKRYLRELREHYDDALREELGKTGNHASAEQAAWTRLGDEEHLAESMLSRPEFRSVASRFPRTVFGMGPVLLWLGFCVGTIVFFGFLERTLRFFDLLPPPGPDPLWLYDVIYTGVLFYIRILPAIISGLMVLYAIQLRASLKWPLAGAALMTIVTSTMWFKVTLSTEIGQKGELEIFSTLLPFIFPYTDAMGGMDSGGLVDGLLRAAIMFAITVAPCLALRRWVQQHSIA